MVKKIIISKDEIPFKFEPSCEQEVVAIFSAIARRLGYVILDLGTTFPDCRAMKIDTRHEVRIEFEYRASDFVNHGHNSDGCDTIVCWEKDVTLTKPEVISLKEFLPTLPPKPGLQKSPKIDIHRIIIARALEHDGIPYPELNELLGRFHSRNVNEPIRCIARLFKWGCFPYSHNGKLKIKNQPIIKDRRYAVQNDEFLMNLGRELLQLLKEEWEENTIDV